MKMGHNKGVYLVEIGLSIWEKEKIDHLGKSGTFNQIIQLAQGRVPRQWLEILEQIGTFGFE